ncbi:hypothetical protein GWI33_004392 [Rhynchophorus ferrugineus]|uniref:Glutaredoxin domain-containing protein n=1 Tax=Rhynchophorus ferrugineus TaxID=354439 RepID=A0A834MN07_RHYFE|nr:hypothetical protein GWI33_004392 [Rhynchophorus ferrugineus]
MPTLIKDQKTFDEVIKEPNLSVIHFQAEWAEQCIQINDVLDALVKQSDFANIKFYSCPAEEKIDRIDGADVAKLTETIKLHKGVSENKTQSLDERLKSLINTSKVMLFMKGDRTTPRCGFSRKIIEILNDTGVTYETFDILQDEEVRQGLKTYSDWPTYPQLYVNGDLIGGLDIVKELLASGELPATLNG